MLDFQLYTGVELGTAVASADVVVVVVKDDESRSNVPPTSLSTSY